MQKLFQAHIAQDHASKNTCIISLVRQVEIIDGVKTSGFFFGAIDWNCYHALNTVPYYNTVATTDFKGGLGSIYRVTTNNKGGRIM